jgi:AcrR family transcriptional regulator
MDKLSLIRSRQSEQTRRRLIDAGIDAFARHGYERATVDLIARAAGCSKGAFYVHFASKEEMLLEAMAEAAHDLDGPPDTSINMQVNNLARFMIDRPYWAALVNELSTLAWRNEPVKLGMAQFWGKCLVRLEQAFLLDNNSVSGAREQAELLLAVFRGCIAEPAMTAPHMQRVLMSQLRMMRAEGLLQRGAA